MTPQATEPEPVALNVVSRPDPRPDPPPSIDLRETAALCTAISRLQSESDLQPLLSRASTLLNASGVVVWMAAGEEMFPVAWHGYDSKHLSQLGPIGHSSLNAAADAWRTGTLQYRGRGRRVAVSDRCTAARRRAMHGRSGHRSVRGPRSRHTNAGSDNTHCRSTFDGAWWLAGRQLDATGRGCPVRASRRLFLNQIARAPR